MYYGVKFSLRSWVFTTDGFLDYQRGVKIPNNSRPSGQFYLILWGRTAYLCLSGGNEMKKVGIIMGSDSDLPVVEKAINVLRDFNIPFEVHIYSAHRTPEQAREFAVNARANGYGALICAAGMAAHLAGAIAANTTIPVIGIPIKSSLEGMDALLATVQMPSGIPVATVAINGAANAAFLAAEIIALSDDELAAKLDARRKADADTVLSKDAKVSAQYNN